MTKVLRTERHFINKSASIYDIVDVLCYKSKNVYNYTNYLIRQEFINNGNWLRYNDLAGIVKDSDTYRDLGSNVGQQTMRILDRDWISFFEATKSWNKNKKKFLGKPNIPKYLAKDGRFILSIDSNKFSVKDGYVRFSWKPLRCLNKIFKTKVEAKGRLIQVRFVPKNGFYVMEIVYEISAPKYLEESKRIVGIDIGINNLVTVGNNARLQPFIINGRPLKSMNQYYNKKKARLQSDLKVRHNMNWSNKLQQLMNKRNSKIENYMHESSRYIIDWCINKDIDTIVIGKNDEWKQSSTLSAKVNQQFIGIPYESLIQKIQYKAENVGIKVIEVEESYTSGTSFRDNESPTKINYDITRRIKRGLFKDSVGTLINADLNASYQIIKKVFPEVFKDGIEGVGLHPVRINI